MASAIIAGFLVWAGVGLPVAPVEEPVLEIPSIKLTGYNALPEQTNSDPHVTASGAGSNHEVVIARSRDLADVLPYGTIVSLRASGDEFSCGFERVSHLVGYRVVADTMHIRKERQMDVMFGTADSIYLGGRRVNPANAIGVCEATVTVVGSLDIKQIPATQAELAALVESGS